MSDQSGQGSQRPSSRYIDDSDQRTQPRPIRYRLGHHPLTVPPEDCRVELTVVLDLRASQTARSSAGPHQSPIRGNASNAHQPPLMVEVNKNAVEIARQLLILATRRAALFDEGFSRDPAWNILLDLLIQHSQARKVSITSACIASLAPPTTALRHINALVRSGRIERIPDPADHRRAHLRLSHDTRVALVEMLLACSLD